MRIFEYSVDWKVRALNNSKKAFSHYWYIYYILCIWRRAKEKVIRSYIHNVKQFVPEIFCIQNFKICRYFFNEPAHIYLKSFATRVLVSIE